MKLHQLTGLAIEDLQTEYDELIKHIEYLKSLLASRQLRLDIVKEELLEVKNKYANPRRTLLEHSDDDFSIADLIERHACVITVSSTGYVQRVHTDTFKTQHRGGKGVKGMGTKEEDYIEHLFIADSHDLILFFTNTGNMYWLNVYEIPEGSRTGKGKAVINLIRVEPGEQIQAMVTVKKEDMERDDLYVTMAAKTGYIKKTPLSAFKNLRKGGIRAITIEEGDALVDVAITDGSYEILMSSSKGMACRFAETEVRPMGRTARGVTGIRYKLEGDFLVGMLAVKPPENEDDELPKDEEASEEIEENIEDTDIEEANEDTEGAFEVDTTKPQVLVISDTGMGKRSYVNLYRMTRRGAKGVVSIRLKPNQSVVSALQIEKGDEILITTKNGQTVRTSCDEIRTIGRASKGVRIMRLRENDTIASVAKLMDINFDDENNEEAQENEDAVDVKAETVQEPSEVDSLTSDNLKDAEISNSTEEK